MGGSRGLWLGVVALVIGVLGYSALKQSAADEGGVQALVEAEGPSLQERAPTPGATPHSLERELARVPPDGGKRTAGSGLPDDPGPFAKLRFEGAGGEPLAGELIVLPGDLEWPPVRVDVPSGGLAFSALEALTLVAGNPAAAREPSFWEHAFALSQGHDAAALRGLLQPEPPADLAWRLEGDELTVTLQPHGSAPLVVFPYMEPSRVGRDQVALAYIDLTKAWRAPFQVRALYSERVHELGYELPTSWAPLSVGYLVELPIDAGWLAQSATSFDVFAGLEVRDAAGHCVTLNLSFLELGRQFTVLAGESPFLQSVTVTSTSGRHRAVHHANIVIDGLVVTEAVRFVDGRGDCMLELPRWRDVRIDLHAADGTLVHRQELGELGSPGSGFDGTLTLDLDVQHRALLVAAEEPEAYSVRLSPRRIDLFGEDWFKVPSDGRLDATKLVDFTPFAVQVRHDKSGVIVGTGTWTHTEPFDARNPSRWGRTVVGFDEPTVDELRLEVAPPRRVDVVASQDVDWRVRFWTEPREVAREDDWPAASVAFDGPQLETQATAAAPYAWVQGERVLYQAKAPGFSDEVRELRPEQAEVVLELPVYTVVPGRVVCTGLPLSRPGQLSADFNDGRLSAAPTAVDMAGAFTLNILHAASAPNEAMEHLAGLKLLLAGPGRLTLLQPNWEFVEGELRVELALGRARFDVAGMSWNSRLGYAFRDAAAGQEGVIVMPNTPDDNRILGDDYLIPAGHYRLTSQVDRLTEPVEFAIVAGELTEVAARYTSHGIVRLRVDEGTRVAYTLVPLELEPLTPHVRPDGRRETRGEVRQGSTGDQLLAAGKWQLALTVVDLNNVEPVRKEVHELHVLPDQRLTFAFP